MSNNHTAEFYKSLNYSTTEFDKSIIFIASGALGISMAFVEKIVKLDTATHKYMLVSAWFFFGGTIFISLLTHFVSIMANRWAIINCPAEDDPYDEDEERKYMLKEQMWNLSIRGLNFLMIITLFLGIILFLLFIKHNVDK